MSKARKKATRPRIIPEKIHLLQVKVFQSSLEAEEGFLEEPKLPASFKISITRKVANKVDEGMTRIRLFIKLDGMHPDQEEPLGITAQYGIEFFFRVDNFKDFVRSEAEGEYQIDALLGSTLIGIAFSTARGIVLERLHGTYFGEVVLPVVSPMQLLMGEREVRTEIPADRKTRHKEKMAKRKG
jgi:hypothetical protein